MAEGTESIADKIAREEAALAGSSQAGSAAAGQKTITGLVGKVRSLAVATKAVADNADDASKAMQKMRQSSQDAVKAMQTDRVAKNIEALESGLAATLWEIWKQIAAIDASDKSLPRLEIEMRRFGGVDLSFLMSLKRALQKAQQKKKSSMGATGRTSFSSALSADEFGDVLGEYSGGGRP